MAGLDMSMSYATLCREGLVHVSELDVTRVENPEALFQVRTIADSRA